LSRPAAADASPLILLSRADRLDLLEILEDPVAVPSAVEEEIRRKGPEDVTARALNETPFLRLVPSPPIPELIGRWDLGAGESSVLAWVRTNSNAVAILDDLEARRCAESLGIPVLGTAGLVLSAKLKGVVSKARPVLEDLISVGMYLSKATLNKLLARVDE
jgi:predicted nucleic acid-binding protein